MDQLPLDEAGDAKKRGSQAIERVFDLLDLVARERDGIEPAELSSRAGLTASTTYRMLRTLVERGYVVRVAGSSRYLLGPRVEELGFSRTLQHTASPRVRGFLRRLHDELGAASYLALLHHEQVTVTHIHDSIEYPRVGELRLGPVADTERTAFGKLLLRARAIEELEKRASRDPQGPTADAARLASRDDVVVEYEEYRPGVACLAAPVRSRRGDTIGAIAISMDPHALRAQREECERSVRRTALLVSAQLEA